MRLLHGEKIKCDVFIKKWAKGTKFLCILKKLTEKVSEMFPFILCYSAVNKEGLNHKSVGR